jgi:biopolymer transport protein ExbD
MLKSINGWSSSQMAARRAARRRPSFYTAINLWGLVCIMVVLLSMFIADSSPHRYKWLPVDLPVARNAVSQPDASREDALQITVVRDGTIYLQGTRVFREDLGNQLREIAEMKVYLAVDKRAKNEYVDAVLDQIRLAGITSVVILAKKSTH